MGIVWIESRQSGKRFHLPVRGDDVNTSDNPIIIPSLNPIRNRCFDHDIEVTLPEFGTFTLAIGVDGRTGSCNQCGECCTHPIGNCPDESGNCGYILDTDRGIHKCQHLTIKNPNSLGKANGTSCDLSENILEIYKGCVLWPQNADEFSQMIWLTNCGYSFGG